MQELQNHFAVAHAWLVPALPFMSAAFVLLVLRPLSARAAGLFATFSVILTAALSWRLAVLCLPELSAKGQSLIPWTVDWVQFQPGMVAGLGVLIDPLSLLLMVIVTTVSSLVHLYSLGYMKGESGFGRYFGVLNLFTGAMLGLVVSTNLFQTYAFWELVGVSSFLLIGYYFEKPSAVAASKKAFIVTRFADLGFFLGVLLVGYLTVLVLHVANPLEYATLNRPDVLAQINALPQIFGLSPLALAALLIFMGAAGKSAMFPLHIWLPDAMEGPTPVSALIHAATMVVAGVYLVARLFPFYSAAGNTLEAVAAIGAFTCIFAAVIACTQEDIKRVLAFSTLSQIGYMMLSLGVARLADAQGYTASLFHLMTHAFFKALLFLGAGSVIHAVHTNDIWKMGGLRKKMPITHLTFLFAVLSISGVPPFAGFFSKDMILVSALGSGHPLIFGVGLLVAGLTAFYMARIYFLTFWGTPRDSHAYDHAHESPWIMALPLLILMVLSAVSGFVPFESWLHLGESAHEVANESLHHTVAIFGTAMGLMGLFGAWAVYGRKSVSTVLPTSPVYLLVKKKFMIDEVYLWVTHRILFGRIAAGIAWFDRNIVDGAVNFSGRVVESGSGILSLLQNGQLQTYAAWLVSGAIASAILLWRFFG